MKILIYTVYYPSPKQIDLPRNTEIVHYFAQECIKMGHDVRVVNMNFRFCSQLKSGMNYIFPKEGDYTYEGIPVHYFDVQSFIPKRWYTSRGQASWIDGRLKRFFHKLDWQPDQVFIQFPTRFTGIEHPFSFSVPTLGIFHNTDRFCLQKDKGTIKRYVSRLNHYGYYNLLIKDEIKKDLGKDSIPAYAGISSDLIAPQPLIEKKVSRQMDTMRILYAGQLIAQKNVDVLIRAVKKVSFPYELEIIGDGEEAEALHQLAKNTNNIHFSGRLAREDVIQRMRQADVFVMVSHTETFGLVYLEAVAQGCLTVGSRGEGIDGILIDGENGFLVKPGNVEETAQVLETIYALRPEDRAAIINKGYQLALDTTNTKMVQREIQVNQ